MLTRRRLLASTALATCSAALPSRIFAAVDFESEMKTLEGASGGRLGVAMYQPSTGARHGYRAAERFPMCSTSKLLAVAAMLHVIDREQDHLDRPIIFSKRDIAGYSPATSSKLGPPGMTLRELCEAAITLSDNTAMNLLLEELGGPNAWTAYARTLGDTVSRLDRNEPTLNECRPGDPRDTTTPEAMLADTQKLILGGALSAHSRDLLTGWMIDCKTGDQKIRAGIPAAWRVGDKTGNSGQGTSNDIAIIWPTGQQPWLLTVYLNDAKVSDAQQSAVSANVARVCVALL
ncbi:beta-lactamase class A [Bryocella elongata]|uniref:Beta-lactamase n=1 Tax=Bryocella elongata TaxID=863522 RepID=A0A1H5ZCR0_9BACT|nr:class A beta-lactamase [Bryocella elongata]SEG34081.1 beta-lactamase class A [Bryocella elongata]